MIKRGNKSGQVTIFIILAVIIILAIVIFFLVSNNPLNASIPEKEDIRGFVENCIVQSGNDVVFRIGEGGGFYNAPEFSTDSGIPYYFSDDKPYLPNKDRIEEEISFYMNKKIFFCTKNFIEFPDFDIKQGEIDVSTKINENDVSFNVKYPISITKGRSSVRLENFDNIRVPIRLGMLYDSSKTIIEQQKGKNGICISCLLNISLKNDFYVDLLDYDESTVIFILRDEKSKVNEKPFRYIFANKYK